MFPRRPGQEPCQYYLKTGKCHYGSRCRFDHPKRDSRLLTALNRRDCFDYMQSGTCPYGASCKYNHPPLNAHLVQCVEAPPRAHGRTNGRVKPVPVPVPVVSSPMQTSPDFSLSSSRGSERRHDTDWCLAAEDPIDLLRRGLRPSAHATDRGASGFDPFGYDTQLFGSWGHSASP